jgi:hypothetical protein
LIRLAWIVPTGGEDRTIDSFSMNSAQKSLMQVPKID